VRYTFPMLKTSTRVLHLLSLLQSRRHWSGRDISERLGVDARTVRRDVDRLRELGYPVHASSGLGGGYQLGAGSSLPPMLLDDDEAVAVAVALRAAAGSVGKMEETTVGLLAKLDQMLPSRLRKRASALYSVTLTLADAEAAPDVEVLTQTAMACRDHLALTLNYRDRQGRATDRTVHPLRLVHTGLRWYLVAWDLQRHDWRTFRVDRIERAPRVGAPFPPRAFPEDIAVYVARSITQAPFRYRMRLKLQGSAHALAPQIPKWCGMLEAIDDKTCILNMGADSMEGLAAQMLLIGVEFEILDSAELMPELRKIAKRLQQAVC